MSARYDGPVPRRYCRLEHCDGAESYCPGFLIDVTYTVLCAHCTISAAYGVTKWWKITAQSNQPCWDVSSLTGWLTDRCSRIHRGTHGSSMSHWRSNQLTNILFMASSPGSSPHQMAWSTSGHPLQHTRRYMKECYSPWCMMMMRTFVERVLNSPQSNRWVLRCWANARGESIAVRRAAGRLFQMCGPATAKLLIPSVVVVLSTNSVPVSADRRCRLLVEWLDDPRRLCDLWWYGRSRVYIQCVTLSKN